MISRSMKNIAKGSCLLGMAMMMMGNKGCNDKKVAEARELKRRVAVLPVAAPIMPLPGGGSFDFGNAATAQLQSVMKESKSFVTTGYEVGGVFDPNRLNDSDRESFFQCEAQSMGVMGGNQKVIMTPEAVCMMDAPQGVLDMNIVNFQLISSTGAEIDLAKWGNLEVNYKYAKSRLTMTTDASHPLNSANVIASTRGTADQIEQNYGGSINFGLIGIGGNYWQKTDLAKVVSNAMTSALKSLKDQYNQNEPVSLPVLKNCDNTVILNGGNASDVGLVVGDEFEIWNITYAWEDRACEPGRYKGAFKRSLAAVVVVESVGDTLSVARVKEFNPNGETILPGARAYVRKLYDPKQAGNKPNK